MTSRGNASFLKILSVFTMLLCLIVAFIRVAWWAPIPVLVGGFTFSWLISPDCAYKSAQERQTLIPHELLLNVLCTTILLDNLGKQSLNQLL